ncbi:MAG: DUF5714 domain-containing protein [Lachnotalea sp.]
MSHQIGVNEDVYMELKQKAVEIQKRAEETTVTQIMMEMMDLPSVPIHHPYHHFILPAAFLTATAIEQKMPEEELIEKLDEANLRANNVLGGFCGNYGACGSGIGAGIFMSIMTDTTPLSNESWQWANEVTGKCLQAISTVPGPRCCKRTGFLAAIEAVDYINSKLGLHLRVDDNIVCRYYDQNNECKREQCPFYLIESICK